MRTPADLRQQAQDCRHLASEADECTAGHLIMLAEEYEAQANQLENPAPPTAEKPGS
jgi:hypothetical protein